MFCIESHESRCIAFRCGSAGGQLEGGKWQLNNTISRAMKFFFDGFEGFSGSNRVHSRQSEKKQHKQKREGDRWRTGLTLLSVTSL